MDSFFAGIDLGTSGCRIIVIDENKSIQHTQSIHYQNPNKQTPQLWLDSVSQLLKEQPDFIRKNLKALAIDGTSGTILLTDKYGNPTSSILMYHDLRATQEAQIIKEIMPMENGGQGASSSLARLLWLLKNEPNANHRHALHQADYILGTLANNYSLSDENNCLKLGYDVFKRIWLKTEMQQLGIDHSMLPQVFKPSTHVAMITPKYAKQLQLPESLQLVSGTTDSIAAFIATGATQIGEAVTSLGSTMVVKLIADQPIFSAKYGVYSHRLGDQWLIGGASNSGGKVLRHYFSVKEMEVLTKMLKPEQLTDLHYYPLIKTGERFPKADPNKQALLSPRPESDSVFFQGMLEGIAEIENSAYKKLYELGAPPLTSIRSVGGGSHNKAWTQIRKNIIKVEMVTPKQSEAAFGSALLAFQGFNDDNDSPTYY